MATASRQPYSPADADGASVRPGSLSPERSTGLHRRLYDWMLHWADTPHGVRALFGLAVAESSVFPLPPDILLLALGVARPRRALWYAAVCSVGSVLGGVLGYLIGFFVWDAARDIFFAYVPGFTPEGFARAQGLYDAYGFLAVMVAGFTPIPYKVFTIASGVFAMNLPLFVLASFLSRSARFFVEGVLLFRFGGKIQEILDRYFNLITVAFLVLLFGGFAAVRLMR
jgi:membrane protein YqaA with SNARE-associated domain